MRILVIVAALLAAVLARPAIAQQAGGAAVVASEPGKAMVARTVEASARIIEIKTADRTVTLQGPRGNVFEVVCGDEVRNFDQLKVGDSVHVRYVESLMLELKKTGHHGAPASGQVGMVRAAPGELPGGAVVRQVTVMASVVAVNPKKSTITLKGPQGNEVVLPVYNRDQFKVVKKGDHVQATYTEAVAISVEPAEAKKN
jgi:hypothetical protein